MGCTLPVIKGLPLPHLSSVKETCLASFFFFFNAKPGSLQDYLSLANAQTGADHEDSSQVEIHEFAQPQ